MEIDHVYICVQQPEKAAEALVRMGLSEGEPNLHPGQGTANRRFFFANTMLELVYVVDQAELNSDRTAVAGLAEQFHHSIRSPIGIVLKPMDPDPEGVPFAADQYHPAYLPEELHMDVGKNTLTHEPKYFFMAFARNRKARNGFQHHLDGDHVRAVTRYTVHQAGAEISSVGQKVLEVSGFGIEIGDLNYLEIEFDQGQRQKSYSFLPDLALVLRW